MAYIEKAYHGINTIEHEVHFNGRYGAKGDKRAPKTKKTKEQIARQNQINKENRVRRTIQANFYPNDYWITLQYPRGTRKPYTEVKQDFDRFVRRLRTEYKTRGEPLKMMYRIEIGKRGGIHCHILINRIWGADLLVSKCWNGKIYFTHLREDEGYRKLAAYLTKDLPELETRMYEQMGFLDQSDIKAMRKYGCSRNLKKPEPEVKRYKRRTVRKLLTQGPKARPGFAIDKESIQVGINQYTGTSYFRYSEVRIKPLERRLKMPGKMQGKEKDVGS